MLPWARLSARRRREPEHRAMSGSRPRAGGARPTSVLSGVAPISAAQGCLGCHEDPVCPHCFRPSRNSMIRPGNAAGMDSTARRSVCARI